MELPLYFSVVSFLISCVSFILSFYILFRDRGAVKAASTFWVDDSGIASLRVHIRNEGKKKIVVERLGAYFVSGKSNTKELGEYVRSLGANEEYEVILIAGDDYTMSSEGEKAIDLWVEDANGSRYSVKNARKYLRKLWKQRIKV